MAAHGFSAKLICSPIGKGCDIPASWFGVSSSIYAIGWGKGLEGTFYRIAACLKKGGTFILAGRTLYTTVLPLKMGGLFKKCYFAESWYPLALEGGALPLSGRMLPTCVTALANAGFVIEKIIEQPNNRLLQRRNNEFAQKAKVLPVTFVN